MAAWVYILECRDGSYYVGCTTNIDQRIGQHLAGEMPGYTSSRLPVEVRHVSEFQTIHDAMDCERQLKRWTRAKKEAVIAGRWDDLPGQSLSRWRREMVERPCVLRHAAQRAATQDDEQGRSGEDEEVG